jgi:hypothetical protein
VKAKFIHAAKGKSGFDRRDECGDCETVELDIPHPVAFARKVENGELPWDVVKKYFPRYPGTGWGITVIIGKRTFNVRA